MTWSEVPQSKEEMLSRAIRAAFLNIDEIIDMCDDSMNPNVAHDMNECQKVVDEADLFIRRNTIKDVRFF